LRADEPPYLVKAQLLAGFQGYMNMATVRWIERSANKPDFKA
jgi:hypothetical protein